MRWCPWVAATSRGLTNLSRSVAEIANQVPNDYQPFVGRSAFAHKGGVHGAAVAKVERSYQHVEPRLVGNEGRLVVSELGGKANTRIRAEQLGMRLEGVVDPQVLSRLIKQLEADGAAFEGAEASFELLIRRHSPGLPSRRSGSSTTPRWSSSARAGSSWPRRPSRSPWTARCCTPRRTATARSTRSTAALRKALGAFYPELDAVHLVDYKVRILDGTAATAARTRVVITSTAGSLEWSTMGSATNIIAASAQALADSLEYAIWKTGASLRRRDERGHRAVIGGAELGLTARQDRVRRPRGAPGDQERLDPGGRGRAQPRIRDPH